MKLSICILLIAFTQATFAQSKADSWALFAKTKFEPKYYEKLGEYLFYPKFSDDLKALEGKEISLEGYFVPFAPENGNYIVLSKYPMSQCYFCGGGGPETIAEVQFVKSPGKFKVDDLILVKGKLKLNTDDPDHINFILTSSVVVPK